MSFDLLATLTHTYIEPLGVPLNGLVFIYLALAFGYAVYKGIKGYAPLLQAKADLEAFNRHLGQFDPNTPQTTLQGHITDYFTQLSDTDQARPIHQKLQHAWHEFNEGIHHHNGHLVNSYQANDFFTPAYLITPATQALDHSAGLYTATGLLFTFVALGAGMAGLEYSDATREIAGLEAFINALAGKFVTSILGLLFALVVDWGLRSQTHVMEASLEGIVTQLNRYVKRQTSESLLNTINEAVKALPQQIEDYLLKSSDSDGLLAKLKQLIEESLNQHVGNIRADLTEIKTNLSGFGDEGAAKLTEVMMQLGPQLKEALTTGLTGDITQLNDTLNKLPALLEASQEAMTDQLEQMKASQGEMVERMQGMLSQSAGQSQASLEGVLNQLAQSSATLQQQLQAYQAEQDTKQAEALAKLTQFTDTLAQKQAQQGQALDDNLAQALGKLTAMTQTLDEKQATQGSALDASLNSALAQMQATLTDIQQSTTTEINTLLAGNQALLAEWEARLTQAQGVMQTQNQLSQTLTQQQQALGGLQQSIETNQVALVQLTNQLGQLQAELAQNTMGTRSTLTQQNELLQNCINQLTATNQSLATEYQRLEQLAQTIAQRYTQAGQGLADTITTMKERATAFYGELGNETANLTKGLQEAISSLNGAVNDFEDTLSDFRPKGG